MSNKEDELKLLRQVAHDAVMDENCVKPGHCLLSFVFNLMAIECRQEDNSIYFGWNDCRELICGRDPTKPKCVVFLIRNTGTFEPRVRIKCTCEEALDVAHNLATSLTLLGDGGQESLEELCQLSQTDMFSAVKRGLISGVEERFYTPAYVRVGMK